MMEKVVILEIIGLKELLFIGDYFSPLETGMVTICALLIILLVIGKIAPKAAFLLLVAGGAIILYPEHPETGSFPIEEPGEAFTSVLKADSGAMGKEIPPHDNKGVPSKEKEEVRKVTEKNPNDPFYKFTLKGIYNEAVKDEIQNFTGYWPSRKGRHVIEISYDGTFSQNASGERLEYIYSGGSAIIKVNERICCCSDIIHLPEGPIEGRSLGDVKSELENKLLTELISRKGIVFEKIRNCLPQ